MKKARRIGTLMVAVLGLMLCAVLSMTSCNKQGKQGEQKGAEAAKGGKKIIGVSLLKESDDFYITLKGGLEKAAKDMGYDIVILSADNDEMKQSNNIDALLLKNVAAIVICPVNSEGVGSIIQKATDKGVPVFTADIAAKTGKVVAHVASDNYMGGKLAAERMVQLIGKSGKIAIVQQPGTESVTARVAGFVDTAKAAGLTMIVPLFNGKDDQQESERVSDAAILSNPDVKGFFAANDNMAAGANAAIKKSGKNIVLIGYDASPSAQGFIKQGGPWKADVQQDPGKIGEMTIGTIDKFLKGELKPSGDKAENIPVPVSLVDQGTAK